MPTGDRRMGGVTRTRLTVVLTILLLLLFSSGEVVFYDGTSVLGVVRSVVHHGSLATPSHSVCPGDTATSSANST